MSIRVVANDERVEPQIAQIDTDFGRTENPFCQDLWIIFSLIRFRVFSVFRGCQPFSGRHCTTCQFVLWCRPFEKMTYTTVFLGIYPGPAHHFSYDESSQRG